MPELTRSEMIAEMERLNASVKEDNRVVAALIRDMEERGLVVGDIAKRWVANRKRELAESQAENAKMRAWLDQIEDPEADEGPFPPPVT